MQLQEHFWPRLALIPEQTKILLLNLGKKNPVRHLCFNRKLNLKTISYRMWPVSKDTKITS